MMLVHAWLAFMALILAALAQETIVIPASTATITTSHFVSVPGWTVTVTGPTVTVTATLGCSSHTVSTSHPAITADPASTHHPASTTLVPPGFTCPKDGEFVKVVSGTVSLWPCGTPDPTDSITIIPGESTFTVFPTEDTTEVWVTSTQFVAVTDPVTSLLDSTSTVWVSKSEEPTTVVTATSSTTVFLGTSTIFDDSSETGSSQALASSKVALSSSQATISPKVSPASSQATTSKVTLSSSPATTSPRVSLPSSRATTSSKVILSSSQAMVSSKATMSPQASPYASSLAGWGSHGWNSSAYTPGLQGWNSSTHTQSLQGSGNVTGVTGGVTVPPRSRSTTLSHVIVTLNWDATPSAGISAVREAPTPTAHAMNSTSIIFPKYTINASTVADATPTSTPAICGEGCDFGNFTINFDESHGSWANASNPWVGVHQSHHLLFNEGFAYVPTEYDAVSPASPPYLAMYLPNRTTTGQEYRKNGSLPNGGIGAGGVRVINSAYHFDAYGGAFSCNKGPIPLSNGPDPLNCTLEVSGFRWNSTLRQEKLHAISTFDMVPCSEATVNEGGRCELAQIDFAGEGGEFTDLSSIRIRSYYWVDTTEDRVFFMDDLKLGWTDNSFTAGLTRGRGI